MKLLAIIIGLFLFYLPRAQAQDSLSNNRYRSHSIYAAIGTGLPAVLYATAAVYVERQVMSGLFGDHNRLNVKGVYGHWGAYAAGGVFYGGAFAFIRGRNSWHLEADIGAMMIYNKVGHLGDEMHPVIDVRPKANYLAGTPSLGLFIRYQRPRGFFLARFGVAFPEGMQLSLGFAF